MDFEKMEARTSKQMLEELERDIAEAKTHASDVKKV